MKFMKPEILLKQLGRLLQAKRAATGQDAETFAFEHGISRSYYAQVEKGRINMTLARLCEVARAFGLKPSALLKEVGL
jgi:transcriptional regulator with XRE-family HTH domain